MDGEANLLALEPATLAFASSAHRRFGRQRKNGEGSGEAEQMQASGGRASSYWKGCSSASSSSLSFPSNPNFGSAGGSHDCCRGLTSRSPSDVSSVVAEMMGELRWSSSPLVRLLALNLLASMLVGIEG